MPIDIADAAAVKNKAAAEEQWLDQQQRVLDELSARGLPTWFADDLLERQRARRKPPTFAPGRRQVLLA